MTGEVRAEIAVLLRPGGVLLMEHADVQGPATRALVAAGWEEVRTLTDLSGRDRVLHARRSAVRPPQRCTPAAALHDHMIIWSYGHMII